MQGRVVAPPVHRSYQYTFVNVEVDVMLKEICYFLCVFLVAIQPVLALETFETADCVIQLNDNQFESFIQKADKPVIIDFWATWCPPCMEMKPIFEQLANELKEQYLFVSVNIDESSELVKKYDITSIPTFKVIKNGTVIGTFTGYTAKERFIEHINHAIHQEVTQSILFSAIQANDKELVATCLTHKNIDVNRIIQIHIMNIDIPMTPLMMAVSQFMLGGQSSLEIVSMLLSAGAQLDLEVIYPEFDKSMTIIGSSKMTVRSFVEQTAKGRPEEELAANNDMFRQRIAECKARAAELLELFQVAH